MNQAEWSDEFFNSPYGTLGNADYGDIVRGERDELVENAAKFLAANPTCPLNADALATDFISRV